MRARPLQISPYARQHRRALLALNRSSPWHHEHLDWYELAQWLDNALGMALLAWRADTLVGYISLSLPLQNWSWIRLLAIRSGQLPGAVLRELWRGAETWCRAQGIQNIAVLVLNNWLAHYLRAQGFACADALISLSHIGSRLPAAPPGIALRPARDEDAAALARLDRLAFAPPWAISRYDMWQALRTATNATVALAAGEVIGYQLSTQHGGRCHLARLAVAPAFQRQRVGGALLRRLLADLQGRQVKTISVNTQRSNLPSQRLYARYGFFRNGDQYELWRKRLE